MIIVQKHLQILHFLAFSWKPNTSLIPNFLITLTNLHHYAPISPFPSSIRMIRLFLITLLDLLGLWFMDSGSGCIKISVLVGVFRGYKTMSGVQLQSASPALTIQGSQKNEGSVTVATGAESKPKKKICCACPDTKRLRDECIVEHGEAACAKWIEAHRLCLRAEGFNV